MGYIPHVLPHVQGIDGQVFQNHVNPHSDPQPANTAANTDLSASKKPAFVAGFGVLKPPSC